MSKKKKKRSLNLDVIVKFFMQHYDIPTRKDIDKVIARMERLEQLIKKTAKTGYGKRIYDKRITTRSKISGINAGITASDKVLDIIRNAENGINFAEIKTKTGFEEKKLRNIIYRLSNTGRIQNKARGVYIISDS